MGILRPHFEGGFLRTIGPCKILSGFLPELAKISPDSESTGLNIGHQNFIVFEIRSSMRVAVTSGREQTFSGAVSRAVPVPTPVDPDSRFSLERASGVVASQGSPAFEPEALVAFEPGSRMRPRYPLLIDLANDETIRNELPTPEPVLPADLTLVVSNRKNVGFEWRSNRDWEIVLIGRNVFDVKHAELPAAGKQTEVELALCVGETFGFF